MNNLKLDLVTAIAKVAHEANRAYCQCLGDDSQLPWEDAPEWQKRSAIDGVLFHLNNPDSTPQANHENWLQQKLAEGWKHGSIKDPEKKEHPCLVPYDQLPVEQRVKDALFSQVVNAIGDGFQWRENVPF